MLDHQEKILNSKIIKFNLRFLLPDKDTSFLNNGLREGKIKSHEMPSVITLITTRIHNQLSSKVINYNKCLENIKLYKKKLIFEFSSNCFYQHDKKRNIISVNIILYNNLKFQLRDILTLTKLFLTDAIHLSEAAFITVLTQKNGKFNTIFSHKLPKKPILEMRNFLTLLDKNELYEYYSNPTIQKLILQYFFPINNIICRITLDKLQNGLPVKKSLRIERYKDEYVKITDIITKDISPDTFNEVILKNNLADFYCGTMDSEFNLKYLIFDLDFSDFFKLIFSKSVRWKLKIKITSAIIYVVRELGIEGYPVVKSSARGLHIVYRYEEGILRDDLNKVNLNNLFYNLPGLYDLIRVSTSPLKSITSFSRLLADSIIVYMIFFEKFEIPTEIKKKLGSKIKPKDIFKLSSFSSAEHTILIDGSPNSRGVFRTAYSVHPTAKSVSIHMLDCKTGEFFEELLDYEKALEETTMSRVLEHIKLKDEWYHRYFQLEHSAIITRQNLEEFLLPNSKLLGCISFVLRFGRREALQRPMGSFRYWYNYYQIRYFFEFVEKRATHCEEKERSIAYSQIVKVAKECNIISDQRVIELARLFLIDNRISGPIFMDRLKGLYHFEFYYRVSPRPLSLTRVNIIGDIVKDKIIRNEYLEKTKNILLIVLEIISNIIERPDDISKRRKEVIFTFLEQIKAYMGVKKRKSKKIPLEDERAQIIFEIYLLIELYNIFINFLKGYYRFTKIIGGKS